MQRSSFTARCLRSIHRTRIISISNDSSKDHEYHLQIARVRRTSSGRSICSYPRQNGRCFKIFENSQFGMSRQFGFVYHDTNGLIHGPVVEDPVIPLERNLYDHPLAGLLWERQFEKILLKHGWEKIPNWGCLFVHREKGLFLSLHVDNLKLAGKKQNLDPMWKLLNKEVDLGEPTSFLDLYTWAALKDNAK